MKRWPRHFALQTHTRESEPVQASKWLLAHQEVLGGTFHCNQFNFNLGLMNFVRTLYKHILYIYKQVLYGFFN